MSVVVFSSMVEPQRCSGEKRQHTARRGSVTESTRVGRKEQTGMFVLKIVFNMNKENTLATASNMADVSRFVGTLAPETPTRPGGGW